MFIHLSFSCLVVVLHMRPQRKLRRAYRRVWWGLGPPRATLTPHSHEGPEVSGGGQGEQAARPRLPKSGAFWPSLHAKEHNPKESEPWTFSFLFHPLKSWEDQRNLCVPHKWQQGPGNLCKKQRMGLWVIKGAAADCLQRSRPRQWATAGRQAGYLRSISQDDPSQTKISRRWRFFWPGNLTGATVVWVEGDIARPRCSSGEPLCTCSALRVQCIQPANQWPSTL